ncbi:phasin family protein [Burkholderia sp. GAS332]|nr:phasin family protein [Burkholderia sp. GAS332]
MNLWNPEQNSVAQQARMEASFALAKRTVEIFQKMIELNLKTARSGITETREVVLKALLGNSLQEWSALQSGTAERIGPQIQSYYQQLFAIASNSHLDFSNVANEYVAGQQRELQEVIDGVARHAPATSEIAIASLKSAIAAAGTWYETTTKAAQQAIRVAESNAAAVSAAVAKTTRQAVEQASRATSK